MEDLKEILADHGAFGIELFFADEKIMRVEEIGFGYGGDLGEILAKGGSEGEAIFFLGVDAVTVAGVVHFYLIYLQISREEVVVGIFVEHPKADQQGDRHPGAEADDVEGAIDFVVDEVTPGGFEEALYHRCAVLVARM
jgi:hypothetical protein